VKGETLMEYEITKREVIGTKRTLTAIASISVLICAVSAIVRSLLIANTQDYSGPIVALLSVATILGLFVALLAFNTRLQIAFDESESAYQAALENQQK
jgi:membrane protein YdbS with pleckstrin-like domain